MSQAKPLSHHTRRNRVSHTHNQSFDIKALMRRRSPDGKSPISKGSSDFPILPKCEDATSSNVGASFDMTTLDDRLHLRSPANFHRKQKGVDIKDPALTLVRPGSRFTISRTESRKNRNCQTSMDGVETDPTGIKFSSETPKKVADPRSDGKRFNLFKETNDRYLEEFKTLTLEMEDLKRRYRLLEKKYTDDTAHLRASFGDEVETLQEVTSKLSTDINHLIEIRDELIDMIANISLEKNQIEMRLEKSEMKTNLLQETLTKRNSDFQELQLRCKHLKSIAEAYHNKAKEHEIVIRKKNEDIRKMESKINEHNINSESPRGKTKPADRRGS